ncbi:MAG: hypothetical protein ACOC4G_03005 [Bacillota bacterium]
MNIRNYSFFIIIFSILISFCGSVQAVNRDFEPYVRVEIINDEINLLLEKPSHEISIKEEVEIYVTTNIESWYLRFELKDDFIHEDRITKFPQNHVLFSINGNKDLIYNLNETHIFYPHNFNHKGLINNTNKTDINERKKYRLKLNLWVDVIENWNNFKAGKYRGEFEVTFINDESY